MPPKWKYFYGCIAPTLLDRHTYAGASAPTKRQEYELTLAKARKMAPGLIGKPIRTEHDKIGCGVITNSWIKQSKPKQWWIQMAIDESKSVGANQVDYITSGVMRGLSLTHWQNSLETVEVSLCRSPAREGAGIVPCDEDPDFQQEPPQPPGSAPEEAETTEQDQQQMELGEDVASPLRCSLIQQEPVLICASKDLLTINYGGLSMRRSADQVNHEAKIVLPGSRLTEVDLLQMTTQQQTPQTQQLPAPTVQTPEQPPHQQQQKANMNPPGSNQNPNPNANPLQASGAGSDSWYGPNRGGQVPGQAGAAPQQIFQFFPQGPQSQQPSASGLPGQQQQQQQHPQAQSMMNYPPPVGEQFSQQFDAQQRQFQHMNQRQAQEMQHRRGALGMPPQTQLDQFARNAGMGVLPGPNVAPWSQSQQQQQQQPQQQQQNMDLSSGVGGQGHLGDQLQQMMDDTNPPQGLNTDLSGVGGKAGVPKPGTDLNGQAQQQQPQQPQQPQLPGQAPLQQPAAPGAPASNGDWQTVVQKLMNSNVLSTEQKKALLKGINGVVAENKDLQKSLKEYQQEKINDREQFRTVFLTWMMAQNGGNMAPQRKQEVEKAFNEGKFDEMLKVGGKDMLKASQNSLAEHQMVLQMRASQPQVDPSVMAELENFNTLMGAASAGTTDGMLQGSNHMASGLPPVQQAPVIPGQFIYNPPDHFGNGGSVSPMSLFGTTGIYTPSGQPLMNFQGGMLPGSAHGGGAMMPAWQRPTQAPLMQQQQQPLQASGTNLQFINQPQQQPQQQQGSYTNNPAQPTQPGYGYTQTAKLTISSPSPDVQNYLLQASARLTGMKLTSQTMSWGKDFDKKAGDAQFGNVSLISPNVPQGEPVAHAIGRKRRALGEP